MDFDDTPEEALFRSEARAWLEHHAKPRSKESLAERSKWRNPSAEAQAEHVAACRRWQASLADGGWAGITWPHEYGGRGGTAMQQVIFNQEQSQFEVSTGALTVGLAMVGPTLMTWGSPKQKEDHLDSMLRGEELWCQLFSEPEAGSDLAGIRCRAERDGDDWIINGQKVWTSLAQHSEWAILLARTNPAAPKHRGITYFLLDMTTPGIDVRPLRQIDGVAHFNEVFMTDVRIPNRCVVGEIDNGWKVAQTTLQSERMAIGSGDGLRFADLRALVAKTDPDCTLRFRQDIAAAFIRYELLRFLGYRVQTAISQGKSPGAESSVMKLAFSQHIAKTTDLLLSLEGPAGGLGVSGAPDGGFWQQHFLSQWMIRIGGGTDQIQRNILAERVLGLPREPTPDRKIPFSPDETAR